MAFSSRIHVFKVNEPRAWNFEGKSGTSHSAECALLDEAGNIDQVGVLRIPPDMVDKVKANTVYTGHFSMRANPASRKLEPVLTNMVEVPPSARAPARAPATQG